MEKHLILSIICDDQPGVVKKISNVICDNGGNWLESSLNHFAGKFAGVIRLSVPEAQREALSSALKGLNQQRITIHLEDSTISSNAQQSVLACFSAVGPDRPGIVREVSQAFSAYKINLENLNTRCTSAPYSGDPIFEMEGELRIPEGTPMDDVYDQLSQVADELAIDFHIEEINETTE